jgi:hypothetical protein
MKLPHFIAIGSKDIIQQELTDESSQRHVGNTTEEMKNNEKKKKPNQLYKTKYKFCISDMEKFAF